MKNTKTSEKIVNLNNIQSATSDVCNNKLSLWAASQKYGFAKSTLHDKLKEKRPEGICTKGLDPVLSWEEEEKICQWSLKLPNCGFPVQMICKILKEKIHSIMGDLDDFGLIIFSSEIHP